MKEVIQFIILDDDGFIIDTTLRYIEEVSDSIKELITDQEAKNNKDILLYLNYDQYTSITYIEEGRKDDVEYPCILIKRVLVLFLDTSSIEVGE